MAFNDVCKGIYVTTRLLSFINCCINQGRTGNWKWDFLMDCFCFNNILIQILRFAYFPVTNSKGKISFHRHFKTSNGFAYLYTVIYTHMQEDARLEKTVNGLELVLFYLCFFLFSPTFKGFVWWKWDLDNAGETHRVERHFFNVSAFY